MRRFGHIIVVVFLALSLFSCKKGPDIIPRRTMTKIYAEMALADEKLGLLNWSVRKVADTSRVYEPIFEKYGYTSEDFIASEQKYIQDPGRFIKIVKNAVLMVEAEGSELKKEQKRLDEIKDRAAYVKRYAPKHIFLLDSLRDTVFFNFDFQKDMDTAFAGPRLIVWADTVKPAAADSLAVADSLTSRKDSIAAAVDAAKSLLDARKSDSRNKRNRLVKTVENAQVQ